MTDRSVEPDPRRRLRVQLLVVGVLALGVSWLLSPSAHGVALLGWELPGSCASDRWFDISCAACGMTRSFVHSARLQLGSAWHYSPAGVLLFFVVVAQVPIRTAQLVRPHWPLALPRARTVLIVIVTAAVTIWLFRLIGVMPPP